MVQGANYAIFNQTEHVDAAWTLLLDMSAGNGQQVIFRETGNFPTVQSLASLEHLPNYEQRWIDVSQISAEAARPNHLCPNMWNGGTPPAES